MATPKSETQNSLRITRTLAATRAKVWQAWTDRKARTRWFAPSEQYSTVVPELDVKAGGGYRVEMRAPDGKISRVSGRFHEVRAPERLVFTWQWDDPGSEETLVTVELHERGGSTELVLTHERFTSEEGREKHSEGWAGCLDQLAHYVS